MGAGYERYQFIEQLGDGPLGAVHHARDTLSGDDVEIRLIPEELSAPPGAGERFAKEIEPALQLDHPALMTVLDAGDIAGRLYVVSPFVEGITVEEVLGGDSAYGESEALELVRQIADALSYAWDQRRLHLDVQPANILLTLDGDARLLGMGLAMGLDLSALPAGSWPSPYTSPEQARGRVALDCRADIYSLGATLFHMLTATQTVDDDPRHPIADLHEGTRSLAELTSGLSSGVRIVIERMMAPDPQQRYGVWADAIKDLDRVIDGRPPARRLSADPSSSSGQIVIADAGAPPAAEESPYRFSYVPSDADLLFAKVALRNKMVDQETLLRALDLQESAARKGAEFDLGSLMLAHEMLPEEKKAKIDRAGCQWELKRTSRLFVRIIEEHGFVSPKDLTTARERELITERALVDILIEDGFVRERRRAVIVNAMHRIRHRDEDRLVRKSACQRRMMSAVDAGKCIVRQDKAMGLGEYRGFGAIAIEAGYLGADEVAVLRRAARRHMMTGREIDALIDEQRIDASDTRDTGGGAIPGLKPID